jgi:hypothetical protein
MSRAGDRGSAAGPAMGDVRTAGAADDAAAAVAAPGVPRLEYQETAVGRLPVGPAAAPGRMTGGPPGQWRLPPQTGSRAAVTLIVMDRIAVEDVPTAPRRTAPGGERSIFALAGPADGGFLRPVKVFAADPDLLMGLDPPTARVVRDRGIVDSMILAEGVWTPPGPDELGAGAIGLLVLDGLLCRTIGFAGLESPELIGAGDLLRPWEDRGAASLEFATDWRVLERASVAILDASFARRMCRVPGWPRACSAARSSARDGCRSSSRSLTSAGPSRACSCCSGTSPIAGAASPRPALSCRCA